MDTIHVRTAHGTVHRLTVGRAYKLYGCKYANGADSMCGKADCGALTSSAASITSDAVTCAKCLAR